MAIARERQAKYVAKGKKIIDEYRASTPCLFCGSVGDKLEFHHVNPRRGDDSKLLSRYRQTGRHKAFFKEVEECWALCSECHKKLHLRLCDPLPHLYT